MNEMKWNNMLSSKPPVGDPYPKLVRVLDNRSFRVDVATLNAGGRWVVSSGMVTHWTELPSDQWTDARSNPPTNRRRHRKIVRLSEGNGSESVCVRFFSKKGRWETLPKDGIVTAWMHIPKYEMPVYPKEISPCRSGRASAKHQFRKRMKKTPMPSLTKRHSKPIGAAPLDVCYGRDKTAPLCPVIGAAKTGGEDPADHAGASRRKARPHGPRFLP